MFSWICPTCGRDVPPSKTECPHCAEREREAKEAAAAAPVPVAQPYAQESPAQWQQPPAPQYPPQQYAPTQQYPPPQHSAPPPQWQAPPPQHPQQPPQQQYAPPHQYPPQYAQQHPAAWPPQTQRSGPPMWLLIAGFALAFLLIGGGIYYFMQRPAGNNPAEKAGLENPGNASKQKVSNPLQKYVEVVGLRMMQEGKKPVARFVVVNHSSTEIADLKANVTLWASTSRSEEDSIGSFSFALPSIGPNESKELTEPLKTKLKTYEYPDWQNATAEIQITSPAP